MSLERGAGTPASLPDRSAPRRVLMIAYACSPYRGSEPGVGWHRAAEMAKHLEVWVISEEHEFRHDVERYLQETGPIENLHFRFVPRVIASTTIWRLLSGVRPLYYRAYRIWHKRAYRLACKLREEIEFDLVHQSTMCGFREPGQLWKLNIPFIWGPIGGTQNYPWRFLAQAGLHVALTEGVRTVLNNIQLRFAPRIRSAARQAGALVTAMPVVQKAFKSVHGVDSVCLLDVGVSHVVEKPRQYQGRHHPLRLLWSGFFEARKALHLLLKAVARLPIDFEYELRILGGGPQERRWRRQAKRLGVADHCTWVGWLPHEEAMKHMAWADLFVFTSLRDTCGTVVLEALSQGLPVLCLDHQGVGSVITESCGIKVPVTTPREVIEGLRDAIVVAGREDRKLESLSQGAIERAREYLWEQHGDRLAKLYRGAFVKHSISNARSCHGVVPVEHSELPQ